MQSSDIWQIAFAVLTSLGGGAVIILGFSSWLGKVWANRLMEAEKASYANALEELKSKLNQDTESYKIKLKKSEFLFQKEFEAASKLVEFRQSILPEHYSPRMDWGDVEIDIANQFGNIEKYLKNFLGLHGAILSKEIKELVELSIYKAGSNKHYDNPGGPPIHAIIAAREVYEHVQHSEELLIEKVQDQSVT